MQLSLGLNSSLYIQLGMAQCLTLLSLCKDSSDISFHSMEVGKETVQRTPMVMSHTWGFMEAGLWRGESSRSDYADEATYTHIDHHGRCFSLNFKSAQQFSIVLDICIMCLQNPESWRKWAMIFHVLGVRELLGDWIALEWAS